RLYYLYSTRLNLGTVRTEENVFWSFAPHDISVLDYLIGENAVSIEAKGAKFLQNNIYDVTMAQFTYPGNVHAHIFVSWLHPFKEQRLVVIGSKGMLSFDDSSQEKNILYYNKRIDWANGRPVKVEHPDEIIFYEKGMPLEEELKYFIRNLGKRIEIAGGRSGHEVVKILEAVQKKLDDQK
ncbi:MAG: gfo/Idh/MocA family oxidoreductase, partial [Clostridiales bacterium]|nr:gfo/Idh/MocA family oxidoreductase [Clostridiales bacterium]